MIEFVETLARRPATSVVYEVGNLASGIGKVDKGMAIVSVWLIAS